MAEQRPDPVSPPEPALSPGAMLDHFRVIRLLGRGGMGEVYLARDTRLGRKVALKVINAKLIGPEKSVQRFLTEARITAKFSHPHIVTIHAVGDFEGLLYLALEYLEGQTLKDRIEEDPPGIRESMRIGLAIAEALSEAHREKVLHRDLKPGNVIIPKDGRIRVLDFGIAKVVRRTEPRAAQAVPPSAAEAALVTTSDISETGGELFIGTPKYLAPEGWMARKTTEATDIWALGIILFELLAGRHPFAVLSVPVLRSRVCGPDPVPRVDTFREVPADLSGLVARCLEKNPDGRPSAAEVAAALDRMLTVDRVRPAKDQSPFRGLLPFGERHADLFFGRDAQIMAFIERLREDPVLPVVGPSGAGKSSFVRAGVIPRLKEQTAWLVIRLRPGGDPFGTLASRLAAEHDGAITRSGAITASMPIRPERTDAEQTAPDRTEETDSGPEAEAPPRRREPTVTEEGVRRLAAQMMESPLLLNLILQELAERSDSRVMLFVDQIEELYTLVDDERVRRQFMEAVCGGADDRFGPVRVVFTLRDDFLGRAAEGEEVRETLSRVTVLRSPGPEALKEILTRPVEAVGYRYDDPTLVTEIVDAVHAEPTCLPLLQLTATTLWERRDRDRRLISRAAYESIGGVAGALAERADGVLQGMSETQVRLARDLLLRLVSPDGTRRVLAKSQLLEGLPGGATKVLNQLTDARLVSVRKGADERGEAELELVHESAIHAWTRLARWIEESREDRAFLAEVGQAAALWERRGRPDEEVWRGEALQEALRRAARVDQLPEKIQHFLEAAQRRQRRRVRTYRAMVAFVGLVLAAIALLFATKEREAQRQKRRAQAQRKAAIRQRIEALQQRAAAQREGARASLLRGALLEARAKLRGALETADSPLTRALWWRLTESPAYWTKRLGDLPYDADFSPDGEQLAVACRDHALYLFNIRTRSMRVLRGHTDQVFTVAYSPDGRKLATGTWGGEVGLWDIPSGRLRLLGEHTGAVRDTEFSPDGRFVLSASSDGTTRIWDVRTTKETTILRVGTARVDGATFSPDGRRVATGSSDNAVRIWDIASGKVIRTLRGHTEHARRVTFTRDGRLLASSSGDGTVRIWDAASGKSVSVLQGHKGTAMDVGFSADGRLLASAGYDRTVRIWQVADGRIHSVLRGHDGPVYRLAVSPKGDLLASVGPDKTVRLWHMRADRELHEHGAHRSAINGVCFSPDGRQLATASSDKTIRLWEVRSGKTVKVLRGHPGRVWSVSYSPDGRYLASGSYDTTARLWGLRSGMTVKVLRGHRNAIRDLSFSPDGERIVTGSTDATLRLWKVGTGKTFKVLRGHEQPIWVVSFSPDGRWVASSATDQTARVWNAYTGGPHHTFRGHGAPVGGVVFGPDSRFVATGGDDRTIRLWDMRTGKGKIVGRHKGRIYRLDFHPDGERLGAPGSDGNAQILDLKTGRSLMLRGHTGEVNHLRFSPDGRLAATVSDDGTVRLWETDTGRPVWRAPLLRKAAVELFTHRGWIRLDHPGSGPQAAARWRKAVRTRARTASESEDGRLLCIRTHDEELEIWDTKADSRLRREPLGGLEQVFARPDGCVTLAAGIVRLHERSGRSRVLNKEATAVAADPQQILVAAGRHVLVYGPDGSRISEHPADVGITALATVDEHLVAGFRDGNLEIVPTRGPRTRPRFAFENVSSSPVVSLEAGPRGTVIAGFANGLVGMWSMRNGVRLAAARLHGPAVHLLLKARKLYAASDLGQFLVWDLDVFYRPYCELLRQIWTEVPVVWREGILTVRRPPTNHRCAGLGPAPRAQPR